MRSRPPDRGQRLLVLPVPCEGYSVFPLRCQCPFSQLLALSSPAVLFSGAFVIRLLAMGRCSLHYGKKERACSNMIRGRFEHEMTDRAGTTPKSSQQQQPPLLTTPDTDSSSDTSILLQRLSSSPVDMPTARSQSPARLFSEHVYTSAQQPTPVANHHIV